MNSADANTQAKTENVTIRVTPEEKLILKKLAAARESNVDALIRERVDELVAEYERLRRFIGASENSA